MIVKPTKDEREAAELRTEYVLAVQNAELKEFITDAVKAIKVLRTMCDRAGLAAGKEAAQELLDRVPFPGCDICGAPTANKSFMMAGTETVACDECSES